MTELEAISNHLEFLGCEINCGGNRCYASNPQRFCFWYELHRGGIRFWTYYKTNNYSKENRAALLEFLNMMNRVMDMGTASVDANSEVKIAAHIPIPYTKVTFGRFLDLWYEDLEAFIEDHESSEFFQTTVKA